MWCIVLYCVVSDHPDQGRVSGSCRVPYCRRMYCYGMSCRVLYCRVLPSYSLPCRVLSWSIVFLSRPIVLCLVVLFQPLLTLPHPHPHSHPHTPPPLTSHLPCPSHLPGRANRDDDTAHSATPHTTSVASPVTTPHMSRQVSSGMMSQSSSGAGGAGGAGSGPLSVVRLYVNATEFYAKVRGCFGGL